MVMYWCKNKKTAGKAVMAVVVTALFLCCTPSPKERTIKREAHFDIPAYFNAEIARLTKENPTIDKTVIKDSLSETREIQIADWETELSSFVSIDLNKPVYTGILEKDSTANTIKITSSDPKIDISSVKSNIMKMACQSNFVYSEILKIHFIKHMNHSVIPKTKGIV